MDDNNNKKLPRGFYQKEQDPSDWYTAMSSGWENDPGLWGYTSDYNTNENNDPPYQATDLTKTCICGAFTTYGTDIHPELHSDWCQLFKKKDNI